MTNKVKSRFAGKKLTKKEMKDVRGGSTAGGRTVCVECSDTVGGDPHNVMCTKERPGQVCTAQYGATNGLYCSYPYGIQGSSFYKCPSGSGGTEGHTELTQP